MITFIDSSLKMDYQLDTKFKKKLSYFSQLINSYFSLKFNLLEKISETGERILLFRLLLNLECQGKIQ